MGKPILLHLGDDIRWHHELYHRLGQQFDIKRSYGMGREDFKAALQDRAFGDFYAIYRPFWNTGGEMGPWDSELITLLPASCKIYASAGAGFDWVDTKLLARRGIIYCNSAPACTESVADTALWLILSTFRRFTWSSLAARSLAPSQFRDAHQNIAAQTFNPNGFKLGIIGLGRIGQRIAHKAKVALDMKILYNDILRYPASVEKPLDARYYMDLDEMLSESDAVVLATPFIGTAVMNARRFSKMKYGSRFVNIARGKLVDEDALVHALESGRLSSAGLDVHYNEPHVHPKLAGMKNVEVLCHTAGASVNSHMGFERLGMENILNFWATGQALTPVNLEYFDAAKL